MSRQDIQKAAFSLDQLESKFQNLNLVNEHPPCLVISGVRHLTLLRIIHFTDLNSLIFSLFQLLNIPIEWILEIKSYTKDEKKKIPLDALIYLIDDHIKLKVYRSILNHLKHSRQLSKIHLKIVH
jgi:hypothetical protein